MLLRIVLRIAVGVLDVDKPDGAWLVIDTTGSLCLIWFTFEFRTDGIERLMEFFLETMLSST